MKTVSPSVWFLTLGAHLESSGGLLKVFVRSSKTSESLGMGPSLQYLLKLSRVDNRILREIHSKGREIMSGTVKKIPQTRAKDILTQKKVAYFHVRESTGKGAELELRLVEAQLEHKLDNGRMLLFEKTANTFGETR